MAKTKTTKTTPTKSGAAGKKSGAARKGSADLSVIEGGKSTKKGAAAAAVLLKDGKTAANPEALRRALGVYGVEMKEDATTAELLAAVRKHLGSVLKGLKDEEKVKCDAVCKEVSTADTDFCPFCGDEGLEEEAAPSEPEAAAEVTEAAAEETESPAVAIERSTADGLAAASAALDDSVRRINELRTNLATNSYDLGVELRKIHEEELWKARGHESFKSFIEKELDIGRAMAYRLIDITKQFDRNTFEAVGSRKLALIAGIQDADARETALENAKAGATTRDVEREVNEAKGRKSAPEKEKGASPAPKKSGNEITLLAKVGSKAQLVQWRSATSGRPIQAHKDDAYAEFALSEDVKQRIALKKDKDGNIVGVTVAFVRVE